MSLALSLPQLALSVAAGSLTTLSPCVFPLLPLVLGGAVQGNRFAPVAMGVGMMASFAAIGMVLGGLGPALGIDADTVRTAGAAMLIAFALVMLVPRFSARFSQWMLPIASKIPPAPPRRESNRLSVITWRTRRAPDAPSAARTAISRWRVLARARRRFATLAQAISSTRLTAPSNSSSTGFDPCARNSCVG